MKKRGSFPGLRPESFRFAAEGVWNAIRTEAHMRFHVIAALAAVLLGAALGIGPAEWLWVALAIALVWSAELVNTAVEHLVDLVSPERQPLAKAAKDTAAGAVLVAAVFAVVVGCMVFGPRLWALFFSVT
ncbi:MAG TPA: diacylglycerol kinase family protein [Paenibacillaceae bacterium]